MATTINFPIPSVLPVVKGLFKKDSNYAGNGWGNVKRDFLDDKILAKLRNAGYECITSKTEHGDSGDNYYSLYINPASGDVVTLNAINYAEAYDNMGRERGFSTFGNVDLYRGDAMKSVLKHLGYAIDENGYCREIAEIEAERAKKEAEAKEAEKVAETSVAEQSEAQESFTEFFDRVFTAKERQAIKDAWNYGFWGDTDHHFVEEGFEPAYVCMTNDIKNANHFSGKQVSGLISSASQKYKKNENGLLDFISDYWGEGKNDEDVVIFNIERVSREEWSDWAKVEEREVTKKEPKKEQKTADDKKSVEDEKVAQEAQEVVVSDDSSELDSILRGKLSPAEIQRVKNAFNFLINNNAPSLIDWLNTDEDLTKKKIGAYYVGDVHPNHSDWIWTEYKPGKADWKSINGKYYKK